MYNLLKLKIMENIGSITLLPGKTFETYEKEFEENNCDFGNGKGESNLRHGSFVTKKTVVELVACPLSELGFSKPATYSDIVQKAESFGFKKCPDEIGPVAALSLMPALAPLSDDKKYHGIYIPTTYSFFLVGEQEDRIGRFLAGASLHPAVSYYPERVFLFAKQITETD